MMLLLYLGINLLNMDHKSLIGWGGSGIITILGMITLNQAAIITGILTGLSTIGLNMHTFYQRWKKRNKKDIE